MSSITLSIPNQVQKEVHWAPSLATIGFTTIGATIACGPLGGVVGLCSAIADEYLITKGVEKKHLLSSSLFWSQIVISPFLRACSPLLPEMSQGLYLLASLTAGTAAARFADDFMSFEKKLGLPLEAFLTLNRFFDENEIISKKEVKKIFNTFKESPKQGLSLLYSDLREIYHNPLIIKSLQIISLGIFRVTVDSYLLLTLKNYGQNIFFTTWYHEHQKLLEGLTIQSPVTWENLSTLFTTTYQILNDGAKIISLLMLQSINHFACSNGDSYLRNKMGSDILKQSIHKVLEKENGRRVLSTENGKEILHSMLMNLIILFTEGSMKLDSTITDAYNGLLAYDRILNLSPASFFPYFASILPLQTGLKKLGNFSKEISQKHLDNQTKVYTWVGSILEELEPIKLRDGEEFVEQKFTNSASLDNELSQKSDLLKKAYRELQGGFQYLFALTDMMCIAFNLLTKQLNFSEVALFKNSMTTVSNYLSTNLNFNIDSSSVIVAKEKIDGFFEIINAQEPKQAQKREEKGNKIVFKNYLLSLENSTLLKMDGIAFELGKRYALTGKSGCGKSSSLIDLKQGVCGALKSSGEIIFPEGVENSKPKVMFLDQELYLPKDSTLLEAIYFPKIFDHLSSEKQDHLKEQILSFFKELEIDNFIEQSDEKAEGLASKLDQTQYKLSGGQRKKIGIIQAILSQPEILIMDEIFTGLDPNSLIKCQLFLKKYLPQALILSVDHHAADNNYNGFYDAEMHYFDGGVTEKKIQQKLL